jgi:hypothetical protein
MYYAMLCTALYCTVLYCTVLYCTVLYCTVLYCTVLYCTVLYCTVLPLISDQEHDNKRYEVGFYEVNILIITPHLTTIVT